VGATTREEHRLLASALAEELRRRTARRLVGAPGAMTDAELWVDPAVWRRAGQLAGELGELLYGAAQRPHTPGTVRVSATVVLFEMVRAAAGERAR
jgi:hypothetical protein